MLEVRRLLLLRELKLRGTLAEVALALHQSPSSVSQQLSLLQKEAGVSLLRRVGRKVQLTPEAEILVDHATAIIDRLELAQTEIDASLASPAGLVRIAVFQSAALALMPQTLSRLASEYPEIRVTMTQREPEAALYETWTRDFDLVVAEQYPGHSAPWHRELDSMSLLKDAIRLAVPTTGPPWDDVRRLEDAVELPWVMEPAGVASRHWAEQACRQAGFEPDVRFETADLQAHIRLVESGNAVALIPDLMWLGRRASVRLVTLPGAPERSVFTAARAASAQRPAIMACRRLLADTAGSLRLGNSGLPR